MCMETTTSTSTTRLKCHSGSLSSMQLQQQQHWPIAAAARKNDRLGASSFLRHGKGLAMAMLTVAYIGNKCQELKDYYYEVLFASNIATWNNCVTCAALLVFFGGTMTLRYRWEALSRWTKTQVVSTITSVSSIEAMSRIRSSMSVNSMRLFTSLGTVRDGQTRRRSLVIAATDPFLPEDLLQKISLNDMKNILVYSVEVNKPNFKKEEYLLTCRKPARETISLIDKAVNSSRGVSAHPSQRLSSNDCADADALYFAATIRIFADWRSVHLIPDGRFQRYAFGMNLAQRDLISNVGKMERAVHHWIMHHERTSTPQPEGCSSLAVPTLRQLLQFEVDTNVHKNLPRLSDKSAASGLLWTMRQIQYQTSIFANIIRVPVEFPSGKAAVMSAYISTYDQYHGFLIKQVFKGSFDAAPDAEAILLHMHSSSAHCEIDTSTVGESEADQDDDSWLQLPIEDDDDFMDLPCSDLQHAPLSPLDHTLRQLAKEWMKIQRFINQCGGSDDHFDSEKNIMESPNEMQQSSSLKNVSALKSATTEVVAFVGTIQPMLDSCMQMIERFNMNDPSKV